MQGDPRFEKHTRSLFLLLKPKFKILVWNQKLVWNCS